jgi:ribosomal-protein-serine acetyltransferase
MKWAKAVASSTGGARAVTADHEVILSNDVIELRAFRLGDADAIYQAVRESMVELSRWLSWCHADYAIHETIEFLKARGDAFAKDGEHAFAIIERSSGRLVGGTGINQIDPAALRANLGYWLRTSATGLGYATEAARLVAQWALGPYGLERIEIVAAEGNDASRRVAERLGATREALARKRLRVHGASHAAYVFSLVREDLARWQ